MRKGLKILLRLSKEKIEQTIQELKVLQNNLSLHESNLSFLQQERLKEESIANQDTIYSFNLYNYRENLYVKEKICKDQISSLKNSIDGLRDRVLENYIEHKRFEIIKQRYLDRLKKIADKNEQEELEEIANLLQNKRN